MSRSEPPTVGTLPGEDNLDPVTRAVITQLRGLGLVYPLRIDESEIVQFPLDITQVSHVELGHVLSYWTAQHARGTAVLGTLTAQKRALKFQVSKLKARALTDEQVKRRHGELEQQLIRVDVGEAQMTGLVDAYRRYAEAASRELTRRQVEAQLAR